MIFSPVPEFSFLPAPHASYPGLFFSPARVQPLYGAGRKKSSGTGLYDPKYLCVYSEDNKLRASCHNERRRPIFGVKLEAWPKPRRHNMFCISHFLQSVMVFEIVNNFLCIFNAISSEKGCLISVLFLTC